MCGNITPFGYDKIKLENSKGYSLKVNEQEADIVKEIFRLYTFENATICSVTRQLNDRSLKPRIADEWNVSSVKDILANPTYIGKIVWNRRKEKKSTKNGKVIKSRPRNHDYLIYDGLHEPIIDTDIWDLVQEKRKHNIPKVVHNDTIQNPLVGLVFCEKCGKSMQRRPYNKKNKPATLMCPNSKCDNVSSKLYIVEEKIIDSLKIWLENYKIEYSSKSFNDNNESIIKQSIASIEKEIIKEENKLNNVYDFFEERTYDKNEYIKRSTIIKNNIKKLEEKLKEYNSELERSVKAENDNKNIIPKLKNIIELYDKLETSEDKNVLLKSIIGKITYLKTEKAIKTDSDPTNFELNIFPKIPKP